jgi:multidrug efflux pump subunit AcrA (membrane-fusion protein)
LDSDEAVYGLSARQRRFGPAGIHLFNPNRLLTVLAVLFWPLRYFPLLLIPVLLLAGLTTFKHWNDFTADLRRLFAEFSFIIHLILGLFIINLSARLAKGIIIRACGGFVREFGLTFLLGFIPRFYIDQSAISLLDRNGQLWAYGAPLLVRLGYIAFGTLIWATYRSSGTSLASLGLLISQVGLWAFLLAIMPLLPSDGYNWLATYLRQPMLRQKAFLALNAKLQRRPPPASVRSSEAPMLIIFAVSSIIAAVAVVFALLALWGIMLIGSLQGVGAVIFLACLIGFAVWLAGLKARFTRRNEEALEIRLLRSAIEAQSTKATKSRGAQMRPRHLTIWAGVSVALIAVMFLPHAYDPAGPFKILPVQRSEAVAQTDGEVVHAAVREGNWVNAGQVLAKLSSLKQQRDVDLTRRNLQDAETWLARLEETKLVLRQRPDEPIHSGAALHSEREAARDEVERLRKQLDRDQAELERTTIRAPAAGFVTTPNAKLLIGVWLNAGDKFVQIDDTKIVEAELEIAQDDIALVKPGAKVRLRPWSDEGRELVGCVSGIAPSVLDEPNRNDIRETHRPRNAETQFAQETISRQPSGTGVDRSDNRGVIRVKASVPNAGGWLRGGMGGYAKISGPQMTVGEAYFRLLRRFLTVQLWSFVP